jgi:DnaJ family protein C protein 28
LNFDGIGVGTPAQREKQYQNYRANRAAANVFEHRINKVASAMGVDETALAKDTREAKKIKTR